MDIEQLATGAIITALSKTERLRGFINSGDKEPCWDGNIYIHEDKKHSKKNIKKVATQVKGKLVKAGASKDTISGKFGDTFSVRNFATAAKKSFGQKGLRLSAERN